MLIPRCFLNQKLNTSKRTPRAVRLQRNKMCRKIHNLLYAKVAEKYGYTSIDYHTLPILLRRIIRKQCNYIAFTQHPIQSMKSIHLEKWNRESFLFFLKSIKKTSFQRNVLPIHTSAPLHELCYFLILTKKYNITPLFGVGNEWLVPKLQKELAEKLRKETGCEVYEWSNSESVMFGYVNRNNVLLQPPKNVKRIADALGGLHRRKQRLCAFPFLLNSEEKVVKKYLLLLKRKIRKYYCYGNCVQQDRQWNKVCDEWYVRTLARKHREAQRKIRAEVGIAKSLR
ncbi:MAG: hypothetical protein ACRCWQ_12515 [Bacilli bacterium]